MVERVKQRSEADEQAALIEWWAFVHGRYGLPEAALLHIANEGSGSAVRGARLKRLGVRAGVPDLFLAAARRGRHGLWIEMKRGSGRVRAGQTEFLRMLAGQGYETGVCYGFDEARGVIDGYLRAE